MKRGAWLAVLSLAAVSPEASATWYSTQECRTGTVTIEGRRFSTTVCWSSAYWTDDGLSNELDPIFLGGDVGTPPVEYWHYDGDGDQRMDCWKFATEAGVNNSSYGYSSWRAGNWHYGMDIGSRLPNYGHGAPARAIAAGRVSFVGTDPNNGNVIRIHHADGRESVYAHLHSIDVADQAWVAPGYQIGTMNCTGSCRSSVYGDNHVAGTHLHLEIKTFPNAPRDPQHRIDPEAYMARCD